MPQRLPYPKFTVSRGLCDTPTSSRSREAFRYCMTSTERDISYYFRSYAICTKRNITRDRRSGVQKEARRAPHRQTVSRLAYTRKGKKSALLRFLLSFAATIVKRNSRIFIYLYIYIYIYILIFMYNLSLSLSFSRSRSRSPQFLTHPSSHAFRLF
jgi:hypothetical protein